MEEKVSEILENILGLLGLEGSFEVDEKDDAVFVSVDAQDPGILIGRNGETLASLQLILNLIASRQFGQESSKRIIVDVSQWRKSKEEDLASKTASWAQKVIETKEPLELDPMPAWQRRIVHMAVEQTSGVKSESIGEGPERRLVISPDLEKNNLP
ncbi:KH domain-containing protein [Candidatus Daviesbacteria bacterium]|nr:KH domain-containing protein [Candidatus Daviesbacteria bacterium]